MDTANGDADRLVPLETNPTASSTSNVTAALEHLNSTGCHIRYTDGKGRGVFAARSIPAKTVIEISPVILFSVEEYDTHGRHTVLDHYTFKWRDGRVALALGLGSLFNHSESPNASYTIDSATESIRYSTTRNVEQDEELCIFYGHKLWFDPVDAGPSMLSEPSEPDDGWGGLSCVSEIRTAGDDCDDDMIAEGELPFTRVRLQAYDDEDEPGSIRTEMAWVVDIPNAKQTSALLKWLKQSGLETPSMAHLKRIRQQGSKMTVLLALENSLSGPPTLPEDIELSDPYLLPVPRSSALTVTSLKLKNAIWPTSYTPPRKNEPEKWSRARVKWAMKAMQRVVGEAEQARSAGELPIAAYVPVPYDEETRALTQLAKPVVAHDTRTSASHPLRHAIFNLVRAIADRRAARTSSIATPPEVLSSSTSEPIGGSPSVPPSVPSQVVDGQDTGSQNGAHYLLTSLTLFSTHEPCIMCSMALLHSRVKEIFYLIPMSQTGGCGSIACVPGLPGVNHRYAVGRWKLDDGTIKRDMLAIGADLDA